MKNATLVIMAAGIGSRFGGGIKQLEPVGPNGEIIMDYSIYDALKAGFNKIVFVIRHDLEDDFKEIIGKRIEKLVKVEYVFQEVKDIKEQFCDKFQERVKPWGTGQAIICCKEIVKEPFLVINADDYYGREAYQKAYNYLTQINKKTDRLSICMIGFILKNTLSDNGGVTRGVCIVNEKNMLTQIVETPNIMRTKNGVQAVHNEEAIPIDIESEVSMNMWGLTPEIFDILEQEFDEFLAKTDSLDTKTEFLLPTLIGDLLEKNEIEVKVLQSEDKWFGVTYKEDKEMVIRAVKKLIDAGLYL